MPTNDLNVVDQNGVLVLQYPEGPANSMIDRTKFGHGKQGIPCQVEKVMGVDLDNVIETELEPKGRIV